jgi:CRP/FNR family cyclic AMP-dependent transcriptional regulator
MATMTARWAPALQGDDLEVLRRLGRVERFGARRYVYHQDDPAQWAYLVESGLVKLARLSADARETVIDFLGPGDLFGAFDLLDRPATDDFAQALEPSDVRVIRRPDYEAAVTTRPGLLGTVTRVVARRARLLARRLAAHAGQDARARLGELLDRLVDRFGMPTDRGLAVPRSLTHVDLANYIGSARETVTEALAAFARDRKVERRGRAIIVAAPLTASADGRG